MTGIQAVGQDVPSWMEVTWGGIPNVSRPLGALGMGHNTHGDPKSIEVIIGSRDIGCQ